MNHSARVRGDWRGKGVEEEKDQGVRNFKGTAKKGFQLSFSRD